MAASLHLARYPPRAAARMLGAMARHRGARDATPGLVVSRVCMTADLDTVSGGTPTPSRWMLLCGWESAQARDAALAAGRPLAPFLRDAEEAWSVSLDPVRVRQGAWRGWTPSTDGVEKLRRDEAVAVFTYGRLHHRHTLRFAWHNREIVRELAPDPGHVMRVGWFDHLSARGTFSLWRSQGDVVRFSYGDGLHDPVQREAMASSWAHSWFFARLRPVASSGTWEGRDPLAELQGPVSGNSR